MTYSVIVLGEKKGLDLALIRSLGSIPDIEIHLASFTDTYARYSKYLHSYQYLPKADNQSRIAQLKAYIKQTRATVLLPFDIKSIRFVLKHYQKLEELITVCQLPDPKKLDLVSDKYKLNQWLKDNDFPTSPFNNLPADSSALSEAGLNFPILLKPKKDEAVNMQARQIHLFKTYSDLKNRLASTQYNTGSYFLQKYIQGHDIDCSVLAEDGKILAYTIQKGFITSKLKFSPGIKIINNEQLYSQVKRLIAVLSWSGICHLDFRYDRKHDNYKLVDFNPRYWTTLQGSVIAGINFPHLACRHAIGDSIKEKTFRNVHFVLTKPAIRNLLKRSIKKQYSFTETTLYSNLKDPVPFLISSMQNAFTTISKLRSRT